MISDADKTFLILSGKYSVFDIGEKAVGPWKLLGLYYVDKSSVTGEIILEILKDDITYSIDDPDKIITSVYRLSTDHKYLCAFDMEDCRQDELQIAVEDIGWETVSNDIGC